MVLADFLDTRADNLVPSAKCWIYKTASREAKRWPSRIEIHNPTLNYPARERPAISRAEAERRRTTRIARTGPLTVIGEDVLGESFRESTSTLSINCHGCRYHSKHVVPQNSWVVLEIPHPEGWCEPHNVRARVVRVCAPDAADERDLQISVELEISGNVWEMAFPPTDWFAFAESKSALTELPTEHLQAALDVIIQQIIARLRVQLEQELSSCFDHCCRSVRTRRDRSAN